MIFIGYDPKEKVAHDVCMRSISKRSSIKIRKLYSKDIPEYCRDFGEPQSTDFTFTRFLVPMLSDYDGYSIFCDSDFIFLDDVEKLIAIAKRDPEKAVHVAKHPNYIPNGIVKMDGISQHQSIRKNWASLMVFNNSHPTIKKELTPDKINNHPTGRDFHEFKWCSDNDIGSIPLEWNCLDQYYHLENPRGIHFTDGGPWHNITGTRYSGLWEMEHLSR